MTADSLSWILDAAGVPRIQARSGQIELNDPARERLPTTDIGTLEQALMALSGESEQEIERFVGRVQRDGQGVLDGQNERLVAVQRDDTLVVILGSGDRNIAASVSHELANSLGAILGWADLGARARDDGEMRRAFSRITTSARVAEATARHLLETARQDPAPAETIALSRTVREVCELLEPVAAAKDVELTLAIRPEIAVSGTRAQLFTTVWNLVQNAIEATPAGSVVDVGLDGAASEAVFVVRDRGPGIPEGARDKIFRPYFTTKDDGTGLGLHLVRQAVVAMGGTLDLDVSAGAGACFRVHLPLSAHAGKATRESGVVARGLPMSSARILVIDDDFAMRDLLATTLELSGADVTAVADGRAALGLAGPFELALVDLNLSDIRGDEVAAELRRNGVVDRIALVSGAVNIELSTDLCPDGWLRKPFDIDDLVATVHRLVTDPPQSRRNASAG